MKNRDNNSVEFKIKEVKMRVKKGNVSLKTVESELVQNLVEKMQENRKIKGDDVVWNGKTYGEIYDFITSKYKEKNLNIASARGLISRCEVNIGQHRVNIGVSTGIGDMLYEACLKPVKLDFGTFHRLYEELTPRMTSFCDTFDEQLKSFDKMKAFMEVVQDLSAFLNDGLTKKM